MSLPPVGKGKHTRRTYSQSGGKSVKSDCRQAGRQTQALNDIAANRESKGVQRVRLPPIGKAKAQRKRLPPVGKANASVWGRWHAAQKQRKNKGTCDSLERPANDGWVAERFCYFVT